MDTEGRLERYRQADRWPTGESLAAMLDNQHAALAAVRASLPALTRAVQAAAGRLGEAGRLVYVGAGSSGRLAVQDGVELHPTFGWPHDRLLYLIAGGDQALVRSQEGAEDDAPAAEGLVEQHGLGTGDVVLGVAASGSTAFTRAAIVAARRRGALTVGIANNPGAPLLAEAEHPVLLATGPEFLAGSTRMTAGTAQKVALNLFSTQLMTELGRVYDGLMIHVVPSNAKLVRRSQAMVRTIAGCAEPAAVEAYERAGRSIPVAVLMLRGLDRGAGERVVQEARGNLRKALANLESA
jgi:N-acetylmuramic acid 6-phosphate etherase